VNLYKAKQGKLLQRDHGTTSFQTNSKLHPSSEKLVWHCTENILLGPSLNAIIKYMPEHFFVLQDSAGNVFLI
jgi:hypothetical protein